MQQVAESLIQHSAQVNAKNGAGETPLHRASLRGYLELVEALLRAGAVANMASENGDSVLYRAAESGNMEVVKRLLRALADPNMQNAEDYGAYTPLHRAAELGFKDVVFELLKGKADAGMYDAENQTPFMVAMEGSTRDALAPKVKEIEKVLQAGQNMRYEAEEKLMQLQSLTDYLCDPYLQYTEFKKRNKLFWKVLEPRMKACGQGDCHDHSRKTLKYLLHASRGPENQDFEPGSQDDLRREYRQELTKLVDAGIASCEKRLDKAQMFIEKKNLVALPVEECVPGHSSESLTHLAHECLGEGFHWHWLEDDPDDVVSMMDTLYHLNVAQQGRQMYELMYAGAHPCLDRRYPKQFVGEEFHENILSLCLINCASRLNPPFQAIMKNILTGEDFGCHAFRAGPVKKLPAVISRAYEASEEYGVSTRMGAQYVPDYLRCAAVVNEERDLVIVVNKMKKLSLNKDGVEVRRVRNGHHADAEVPIGGYRDIAVDVIFRGDEDEVMYAEVRIVLASFLEAKKQAHMLLQLQNKEL